MNKKYIQSNIIIIKNLGFTICFSDAICQIVFGVTMRRKPKYDVIFASFNFEMYVIRPVIE